MFFTLGRYAEAEPLYQRSIATAERASGKDHPIIADGINNLAETYVKQVGTPMRSRSSSGLLQLANVSSAPIIRTSPAA